MKTADIMSTNVITIDGLRTILEATKLMKQHDVKTLIVDRDRKRDTYGIITQTDIARAIAEGKDPLITYVCEVMTIPCIVVNPNLPVEQIFNLFARTKTRVAPVIKDKLLGIVSISDILTKTNYLTKNKVSSRSIHNQESKELSADLSTVKESEIAEWERKFDNWCSG